VSKEFRRVQAAIPVPYEDVRSLVRSVSAIKDVVEDLAGQRGTVGDTAVTFNDLVRLGLIDRERIPKQLG
jgi:hypothetical protein